MPLMKSSAVTLISVAMYIIYIQRWWKWHILLPMSIRPHLALAICVVFYEGGGGIHILCMHF